jgi:hypothetical protein
VCYTVFHYVMKIQEIKMLGLLINLFIYFFIVYLLMLSIAQIIYH